MLLALRVAIALVLLVFILSALVVHFRSPVRLSLRRQLASHATLFAPWNLLMYHFSAVPTNAYPAREHFPAAEQFRSHWEEMRDEALGLFDEGHIRASLAGDDASFASFFKAGWKRFYVKWYGDPLPSAEALCPKTVALVNRIPSCRAAMFAVLAPDSELKAHRDPYAGSLRYHLGLVTPNSEACHIVVNGESHAWRDGEDVIFDETWVHWVENRTDQKRIIFFADLERPLRSPLLSRLNHALGSFMGRITASPNQANEPAGAVNRLFGALRRQRERSRGLKKRHPRLFKLVKRFLTLVLLWLLLLAPWPF